MMFKTKPSAQTVNERSQQHTIQRLSSEILRIESKAMQDVGIQCPELHLLEDAQEERTAGLVGVMSSWLHGRDIDDVGERKFFNRLSRAYHKGARYASGITLVDSVLSAKPRVFNCYTSSHDESAVISSMFPEKRISAVITVSGRCGHVFLAGEECVFETTSKRHAAFRNSYVSREYPFWTEAPVREGLLSVAHNYAGIILREAGKYEEALSAYDKAIELVPEHSSAWALKGVSLYHLERFEDCLTAFDKAAGTSGDWWAALQAKAMVLYALDRDEESLAVLDKVTELAPKNALAWFYKELALSRLGRPEESAKAHDTAIALNPRITQSIVIRKPILSKTAEVSGMLRK